MVGRTGEEATGKAGARSGQLLMRGTPVAWIRDARDELLRGEPGDRGRHARAW